MLQNIRKHNKGFTIIEVLIVLAIAGLIMLIVFLAVPALQRNSRNTQYKSAAAAVLGAVNEFGNNNNGQLPTTVAIAADGTITVSGGVGTTPATGKTQGGFVGSVGTAMPTVTGTFNIYLNRKCNGNAYSTAASPRAVAIGFVVETSSSATADQCIET